MRINRALTEAIRIERFEDIYDDFHEDRLSCEDAAMMLGCSSRHFLRLRDRYEEEGLAGLGDRRVGQVSKRRAADAEVRRIKRLYQEKYEGFTVRHFHESATRDHGLKFGYTWTRQVLRHSGLLAPVGRGGPHRLRRPRKPMREMMINQDANLTAACSQ
jgi:transposase